MTPVTRVLALVVALVVATALPAALPAAGTTSSYGPTSARDGEPRDGCHDYRYRYVVKTPTNDWLLETFLVDPRGEMIATGVLSSDSEPRRGGARFRFCRYTTRAGVFTIRAKVHWYDGAGEHLRRFDPSRFRLRR